MKTESSHGWEPVRACVAALQIYSVERIRVYGRAPIYRNLIQWMVEGLV